MNSVAVHAKSGTLPASKFGTALANHRGDGNALRWLARCADAGEVVITAPQRAEKVSQALPHFVFLPG